MKYTIILFTSFLSFVSLAQEKKTLDTDEYSIEYPETWELNQSGQMGMSFGLFSPLSFDSDNFRENINLIIQDISAQNMDLEGFTNVSLSQIKTMITNSSILENEKKEDYHQIVYTGDMGIYKLQLIQRYWVIDGVAYILTFTAEQEEFDNYTEVANQIMSSFSIK